MFAFVHGPLALAHPRPHHLPPINIPPVAYPDNGYEEYAIVEVGDDSPIAYAALPEIAEVFAAKRFADAAWVVERPVSDKSGVPGMSQISSEGASTLSVAPHLMRGLANFPHH
jgi:hypothetical protein